MLFQRSVALFRHCFNVGHWRCINVVQRWKPDSDFVSFLTSDQRYFNVDPTLKCWLGLVLMFSCEFLRIPSFTEHLWTYKVWTLPSSVYALVWNQTLALAALQLLLFIIGNNKICKVFLYDKVTKHLRMPSCLFYLSILLV